MSNKIDITVLVTSISQRDIAIETVNYYSEICSNVVFVDEEKTLLNEAEKQLLSNKNILYIPYKSNSKNMICTTYEKRLIAAKKVQKIRMSFIQITMKDIPAMDFKLVLTSSQIIKN